jgi:hypothetical protein
MDSSLFLSDALVHQLSKPTVALLERALQDPLRAVEAKLPSESHVSGISQLLSQQSGTLLVAHGEVEQALARVLPRRPTLLAEP